MELSAEDVLVGVLQEERGDLAQILILHLLVLNEFCLRDPRVYSKTVMLTPAPFINVKMGCLLTSRAALLALPVVSLRGTFRCLDHSVFGSGEAQLTQVR